MVTCKEVNESLISLYDNINEVIEQSGILRGVFYHIIGFTKKEISYFENGKVGFIKLSHIGRINAMFGFEVIKFKLEIKQ